MKVLLGFCASIFLIFLFPISGFAQDSSKPKIQIDYDKFKDQTTYSIPAIQVIGNAYEGIQIGAGFGCDGKSNCEPRAIIFQLVTFVKGYNFFKDTNLIILADDERFKLGEMKSMVRREHIEGMVQYEILIAFLSIDNFSKICKAKKVEMQIGNVEFELKDIHMEALRDLFSHMGEKK